ncbi:MAG: hypothetical protein MK133_02000, partial [Planctomycetes bacterium]|nr:hypothetical protein [Planctomycetota bacterium]
MFPRAAYQLAFLCAVFLLSAGSVTAADVRPEGSGIRTGLEVASAGGFKELKGKKVGVVTNPTGVDRRLV